MQRITPPNTDLTKPIKQPKKRKPIKQQGKHALLWAEARHTWIQNNIQPYWTCWLQISPGCLRTLTLETLTLDHYHTRSSRQDLRYEQSNLRPCCVFCNGLRGSRSIENLAKDYPQVKNHA